MAIYLRGIGGAPGIAFGYAVRYTPETGGRPRADADPEAALARLAQAQRAAADQLAGLAALMRQEGREDEAGIFDAQALLVEDPYLSGEVARRVRDGHAALETAVSATVAQMRAAMASLDDPYLRDRAPDMDAVGRAVIAALRGERQGAGEVRRIHDMPAGAIIIADDLAPAEIVALRGGAVAGFALAQGGPTSHTLILARAFGIPAVVGLGAATFAVLDSAALVLDGEGALLIVDADEEERAAYAHRAHGGAVSASRTALRDVPGRLSDGHPVALWANIGRPDDARHAIENGAEGIGLFRTEFLFMERGAPPPEDEQYQAYRATLDRMDGRTVVVRTLDAGGDKPIPYLDLPAEPNPALGLRGIRLSMRRPELFHTQIRAALRAAAFGELWLMLPMVTDAEDLAWARGQVRAAAEQLAAEGIAHRADLPIGAMIETPAAAIMADQLARHAAFFSIGSNDLAQYTLAVDRSSGELAARYPHASPAVLRMISQAASAAARARISVCVCGELAAIPSAAPILAGLGVHQLSMAPPAIPAVKERLREVSRPLARSLARRALAE
jgi:phosphotransferase system enzyme I (PtsI)